MYTDRSPIQLDCTVSDDDNGWMAVDTSFVLSIADSEWKGYEGVNR